MFRSFEPELYVHRLPGLEPVVVLTNLAPIIAFSFSPTGDEVAIGSDGGVEIWNTANWQRARHLPGFTGLLYSPDARTVWLSSSFRSAGLHDARDMALILPLPLGTLPLATSPDGRLLAVSVDSRRPQLWDLEAMRAHLRDLGLDWRD
jgi:WD40 repeat protein